MNPRMNPWMPHEDAVIRSIAKPRSRVKRRLNWERLLAALPGRSRSAITNRMCRLYADVPRPGRPWTPAEDAVIHREWGELARRSLMQKLPGRSWAGILDRAQNLGYGSVPQGWVFLKGAGNALGFDVPTIMGIIAWANTCAVWVEGLTRMFGLIGHLTGERVEAFDVETIDFGGVRVRLHTTSEDRYGRDPDGIHRWRLVQPEALEEAVRRWLAWESMADAARRWGMPYAVMFALCRSAGRELTGRRPTRMPPQWFDDAVTRAGWKPGGMSVAEHARRLGVHRETLRRRLSEAGVLAERRGSKQWVSIAEVEAVLARVAPVPGLVRAQPRTEGARSEAA